MGFLGFYFGVGLEVEASGFRFRALGRGLLCKVDGSFQTRPACLLPQIWLGPYFDNVCLAPVWVCCRSFVGGRGLEFPNLSELLFLELAGPPQNSRALKP